MKNEDPVGGAENVESTDPRYEAPGIEAVLTPEELEREVLYGGTGTLDVC